MKWYFITLKKYAVFSGRARRKEFWTFYLFNIIILFILIVIEVLLEIAGIKPESERSIFGGLYQLFILIPSIAVGVRRMHDTNHSGWWFFIPFINLLLAIDEGTPGNNNYGYNPKAESI